MRRKGSGRIEKWEIVFQKKKRKTEDEMARRC
jgi:hypothetical protein